MEDQRACSRDSHPGQVAIRLSLSTRYGAREGSLNALGIIPRFRMRGYEIVLHSIFKPIVRWRNDKIQTLIKRILMSGCPRATA